METLRLAILADAHLPDCPGSAQEAALRWAVGAVPADWLVLVGDMTAAGESGAAERVATILASQDVPWVSTPGNAELRTPAAADEVCQILSVCRDDSPVLLVDTSRGTVPEAERERAERRLAAKPLVLATHWPPDELPEEDRAWFAEIVARSSIELLVAGHKHYDQLRDFVGKPLHLVRGLDPDKAKHDLPAVSLFTRTDMGWQRADLGFPEADPRRWPEAAKAEFLSHLGVSTMDQPVRGTREATELGIQTLEQRAEPALRADRAELLAAVGDWRQAGGRCLSLHLPDLRWNGREIVGYEAFRAAIALCRDLAADRVTLHVPRAKVAEMANATMWRRFLGAFREELAPLRDLGATVGIENLHRNRGETADDQRGFGYLPDECLAWIADLREALSGVPVGLHLDIGHARNNSPFSQSWILGRWYAAVGGAAVGYHLHQVTEKGNHQPFPTPFAPLLSLASFFWAWQTGQLRHAPMILEIRAQPGIFSWQRLRDFIREGEVSCG